MKGRVDAYDPVNGFGFIKAGGVTYFAHNSDVNLDLPVEIAADLTVDLPPAFLLPGWDVEFEPVKQPDGRWKATEIKPVSPTGFTISPLQSRPAVTQDGLVALAVSGDNTITILGRKVEPTVKSEHFEIYYLGKGTVRGFSVKLPQPTAKKTFLVITPSPEKAPRQVPPDGLYKDVRRGSFIMTVEHDGHVLVQKIGAHFYNFGDNWLALSRRFEHKYNFPPEPTKDELLRQTPDVGKADANWGFAPGILRGLELMKAAA